MNKTIFLGMMALSLMTSIAFADSMTFNCQANIGAPLHQIPQTIKKTIVFGDADTTKTITSKEIVSVNGFSYSLVYTNLSLANPEILSPPSLDLWKTDANGTVKLTVYAAVSFSFTDSEESKSIADGKTVSITCIVPKN